MRRAFMPIYRIDFDSMLEGKEALKKLKDLGYRKIYLDMVEKYNEEYSEELTAESPVNTPNLSSALLQSGKSKVNLEKSSLAASNPFVNGVGSLCELDGNKAISLYITYDTNQLEELKSMFWVNQGDGSPDSRISVNQENRPLDSPY
jgi:hypothetical protein